MNREKIFAWIKIIRLHFYPMTWLAYSLGAMAASRKFAQWDLAAYCVGYLVLFFIELSTILANEYYDYGTDRLNKNAGPFTGGTRVLVEGKLGFAEVRAGIWASLGLAAGFAYLLFRVGGQGWSLSILLLIFTGLFLGLGYTVPPLKFSYRGLGEVTVAFTHSPYVILCGYVFQGGSWADPLPWILSIPLFLATLAAIILAGIPDRLADREVSKKGVAVLWGPREAVLLASLFVCLASLSGVLLGHFHIFPGSAGKWIWGAVPHGIILLLVLFKLIRSGNYDRRIDGIMALALSYIIWFGLIPFISFF
jgi:1,4-dihydroxy-2-naphthoate octaprenyltransferase